MALFELTVQLSAEERPSALALVEALDRATGGRTSDVAIDRIDDVRGEDVVAVVKVPAYMAVCRRCNWKMRYNRKVEAERFAGMHRSQRHDDEK